MDAISIRLVDVEDIRVFPWDVCSVQFFFARNKSFAPLPFSSLPQKSRSQFQGETNNSRVVTIYVFFLISHWVTYYYPCPHKDGTTKDGTALFLVADPDLIVCDPRPLAVLANLGHCSPIPSFRSLIPHNKKQKQNSSVFKEITNRKIHPRYANLSNSCSMQTVRNAINEKRPLLGT